jgi:poly(A) polymerase
LLAHVPPSRLLDEMMKLLLSGHAAEAVAQLRKEGLHHGVLPLLDAAMGRAAGERFVEAALRSTDERVRAGKTVSPGFLFAALLWPEVLAEWKVLEEKSMPPIPALYQAMDHVMKAQAGKLAIPHRYGADMREIWAMQPRFLQRAGKRPYRLLEHPRFRAGYDFLLLRCQSGEIEPALGEWWERFQSASEPERAQMLVSDSDPHQRRRRRRRKPRGPRGAPAQGGDASPAG